MNRVRTLMFVSAVFGLVYFGCKFGTDTEGSAVSVNSLQIKEDVEQWGEQADGFKPFTSLEGLTAIINGGADEYDQGE